MIPNFGNSHYTFPKHHIKQIPICISDQVTHSSLFLASQLQTKHVTFTDLLTIVLEVQHHPALSVLRPTPILAGAMLQQLKGLWNPIFHDTQKYFNLPAYLHLYIHHRRLQNNENAKNKARYIIILKLSHVLYFYNF